MRTEQRALLGDLAQLRQRHHLEAAGIRQDRSIPVHEFMQAAQPRDSLGAGPQHQVVGIAQKNVGAGSPHACGSMALTVAADAHRHEGGGANVSAPGTDHTQAGFAVQPALRSQSHSCREIARPQMKTRIFRDFRPGGTIAIPQHGYFWSDLSRFPKPL